MSQSALQKNEAEVIEDQILNPEEESAQIANFGLEKPAGQTSNNNPENPSEAFLTFLNLYEKDKKEGIPNSKTDIDDLNSKELFLNDVASQLKSEFIGLDQQIDKIINTLRPWYLIPKSLNKPVILSLWGMSGVGKTSLVYRLVEKLNFESTFFKYDLGKISDVQSGMGYHLSYFANRQSVLFFDEVQMARTLDAVGHDIDRPQLRDFWTLLDTGMLPILFTEIVRMRNDIKSRYQGFVANPYGPELLMTDYDFDYLAPVLGLSRDYNTLLKKCVVDDTNRLMNWIINEIEKKISKNVYEDHTKALIILAGNIDEAYSQLMTVEPDEFTAEELKENLNTVTPTKIKKGLLTRFRTEQVARMGTSLILFPTPSESSYQGIIKQKLSRIENKIKKDFVFEFKFEQSVHDMIYKKGVIPTQGVRPILSMISEQVESRLPTWIVESAKNGFSEYSVNFDGAKNAFTISHKNKTIFTDVLLTEIESIKIKIPDAKFIEYLAIHEAAHLVVGISLMGMLPQRIIFKESFAGNVMPQVRFRPTSLLTAKISMDFVAMNLAGYAAEIKKYGKEGLSSGATMDLKSATGLVSQMIMEMGMGSHIGVTLPHPDLVHNIKSMQAADDEAKEKLLKQAYVTAEQELKTQSLFYDHVVEELKTKHCLPQERLAELLFKHFEATDEEKVNIVNRKNHKYMD